MKLFDKAVKRSKLYKDLERKMIGIQNNDDRLQKDIAVLEERIAEVSKRIVNVSVQRHENRSYPLMRVVCDIDTMALERSLMWGNDSRVIEMMARDIGYRAAQQIKQCNFQRWEK